MILGSKYVGAILNILI